jgi:hypothetical protein
MMKRLNWVLIASFLGIIVLLSGCGGGGGGSTPPAFSNVIGIGVVMQSSSSIGIESIGGNRSVDPALKEIVLPPNSFRAQQAENFKSNAFKIASMSTTLLTGNPAFIYLQWDPVSGANDYQVSYQGNTVWDSDTTHPHGSQSGDPAFNPAAPKAYLDLDQELNKLISSPDVYTFQITALNGTTTIALATVTASLGMYLENYPGNIGYTQGTAQLTWDVVSKASGYHIRAYLEDWTKKLDSGSTLVTGSPYTFTGLTSGTYYNVTVDAQYLDDGSSTPLEITRGLTKFQY